MFLSDLNRKGKTASDPEKKLGSLAANRPFHPAHLSAQELLPAKAQFCPSSRMPTRGATELTKDQRHSAHLRKKRHQKSEHRRQEQMKRSLAQTSTKVRKQVEKEDALKMLRKNRNVQIIGKAGRK